MRDSAWYHVTRSVAFAGLGLVFLPQRFKKRKVIVFQNCRDFARKSAAIADLLRRRDIPVEIRTGGSWLMRAEVRASADLWIGFWNEYPLDSLPRTFIFFNAEPLCVDRWGGDTPWMAAMRSASAVWDYSKAHEPRVSALGVPFRFVPFGYAPHYEDVYRRHVGGKAIAQDIDVLFVGGLLERRKSILERVKATGVRVHTVTRDNPAHGEKLDELLAASKIVLNVHAFDDPQAQIVDLARLDHLLANRVFVLHEALADAAVDAEFSRHVPTCAYDRIPEMCAHYAARPEERKRIADAAYEWFKAELDLDKIIPFDEIRNAIEELS